MGVRLAEAPVLAAVFLDLLGFGMVIADIQLRAEAMAPKGWSPGVVVGGLLATTFIVQLAVSPHWGRLSDRVGRKPVIVACTALSAAAMLVYGLAGGIWVLAVSRVLSGFGAANVAVVQAFLTDQNDGSERTVALGRIGAAISAGLVVGPSVGGFLAAIGGNRLIGFTAAASSLVGVLLLAVALPKAKSTSSTGNHEPSPMFDLRLVRELPSLRPLFLIAVVAWFSLATLEGTFARLIEHLYRYDQREFGVIFGYESLLGIVVQGVLLSFVARRFSEPFLLKTAYLIQGLGLTINPFAGMFGAAVVPFVVLLGASTLYSVGSGLANPTVNGMCSRLTPDSRQGELFGLLQGMRSVGFVVGPVLGGALFDWQPAAPYLLAGAVCVGAAVLVPRVTPVFR